MNLTRKLGLKAAVAFLYLSCALGTPAVLAQVPVPGSAVNSASFAPPGEPNSKLARGGIFSVFGASMSASTTAATSFPLPTALGGAEIEITVAGVTRKAILLYVSPGQINAIMPSDLPAGSGTLRVLANGQVSQPLAIEVVDHSFGIYTLRSSGEGPGVITDPVDPNPATAPNTALRSAHAGELWDLWGTGLTGIETSDAELPPFVDRTNLDVKVLVAGVEAEVLFRGRSPCCAGLDQIRFRVPAGIEGCCVSVQVVVNGVASNAVTMSLANEGRICPIAILENIPDEVLDLLNGEAIRNGGVSLTRGRTFTTPTQGRLQETASGVFTEVQIRGLILDPCPPTGNVPVPTGPCTVTRFDSTSITYIVFDLDGNLLDRTTLDRNASAAAVARLSQTPALSFDQLTETALAQVQVLTTAPKDQAAYRGLDAGPALTMEGPNGPWQVPRVSPGIYGLALSDVEINGQGQGVVQTGQYRASAPGGTDIPSFSVDLAVPSPLEWTNKAEAFPEILRHQPLRVEWNGGMSPFEIAQIGGLSILTPGSSSIFECAVPYPRGGFTIPATVLRNMVRTGPAAGSGRLTISTAAGRFLFSLPGLDFFNSVYYDTTTLLVPYRGEGE